MHCKDKAQCCCVAYMTNQLSAVFHGTEMTAQMGGFTGCLKTIKLYNSCPLNCYHVI